MKKALFLDRDGVINVDHGYVHRKEDFEPIPKNLKFIKRILGEDDYLVFIVTNQAGIGRGYYTEEEFLKFQKWVEKWLADEGIKVEKTYYCPHHPEAGLGDYKKVCECRKPKSGMLLKVAEEYEIDLSQSVLIGDKESDLEAGRGAGCRVFKCDEVI
jgi:D-glycero-D-manno-heptose 1,7-bisphosphate phosphatase